MNAITRATDAARKQIIDAASDENGIDTAGLCDKLDCKPHYITRRCNELINTGLLFCRQYSKATRYFARQYHADAWLQRQINPHIVGNPDLPAGGEFAMALPRCISVLEGTYQHQEPMRRPGSMDYARFPSHCGDRLVYRDGRVEPLAQLAEQVS